MRSRVIIGTLFCLIGALWIGQGVGVVKGSFMTGQGVWAVIGVVAILIGLALFRGARPRDDDDRDGPPD